MGCNIGCTERGAFAPSLYPGVRDHTDDRRIEGTVLSTTRKEVDAARIREVDLEDVDFLNLEVVHFRRFHSGMTRTSLPLIVLDRKSSCAWTISSKE